MAGGGISQNDLTNKSIFPSILPSKVNPMNFYA